MGVPQVNVATHATKEVTPVSKRRFRATKIQDIRLDDLLKAATGLRLVVGIDVAKCEQFAAVREYRGEPEETVLLVSWKHPEETTQFVELCQAFAGSASLIEVVMEPTGTYGDPIRYELVAAGLPVFRAGAKRSHDAAEVFDGVPSMHDRKAAWVLTRLHETGATQPWGLASEEQRTLRALYEAWRLCESEHERYVGRLEGVLARYWPGIPERLNLTRLTLPCLLEEFGGPTGVAAAPDAARAMMRRVGGSQLRQEVIDAVVQSAQEQAAKMREQKVELVAAEEAFIKRLAAGAHRSRDEAAQARKELEKHVPEPCQALRQVVGPTLTVALLGSGIDPRQVASPQAFEKALGLNLKVFSSGESKKGGLHISKRGDGALRKLLYLATLRLLQEDATVRAWYDRKVAREAGKAKIKAVTAVMRKLARALWHVARGQPFDATKLFDTRRLEPKPPPGLFAGRRYRARQTSEEPKDALPLGVTPESEEASMP